LVIAIVGTAWLANPYRQGEAAASVAPPGLPQVGVSKPLVREVDARLGFLGQLSAIEQLEIRAQVGGTLTGIHFKDGDIVHQGDLCSSVSSR
jgi:membrane fusion protein, multidrug efflux system